MAVQRALTATPKQLRELYIGLHLPGREERQFKERAPVNAWRKGGIMTAHPFIS
jgi:hypothetical protein